MSDTETTILFYPHIELKMFKILVVHQWKESIFQLVLLIEFWIVSLTSGCLLGSVGTRGMGPKLQWPHVSLQLALTVVYHLGRIGAIIILCRKICKIVRSRGDNVQYNSWPTVLETYFILIISTHNSAGFLPFE